MVPQDERAEPADEAEVAQIRTLRKTGLKKKKKEPAMQAGGTMLENG